MSVNFDLQRFAVITSNANNAVVGGYDSADSITTSGNNVVIYAGGGNDYVFNSYGSNVRMYGEDGKDSLHNYMGNNLRADAGSGDDYFNSYLANNVSVNGGAGNDTIQNYGGGANVTMSGGAGNDSISNYGEKAKISGGAGKDTVRNYGGNSSIDGGADNDLISNDRASKVTMSGGAGNDTLWNWSTVDSISAGANVSMAGGAGNDTIWNGGEKVTIDAGAGNDSITNNTSGSNAKINGGAGNDNVTNFAGKVTISGGTGNDTISLTSAASNNLIVYNEGDGNDVIRGINSTSTLQIGDGTGSYSSVKSGSDLIVTVGEGKITLKGASSTAFTILGKPDTDPKNISNSSNNTLLSGSTLNDTITSSGSSVTINAGDGADIISTDNSKNISISAGSGNDSIFCRSNYSTVNGDDGNDTVSNITYYSSINGGTGNDSIYNYSYYSTINGGAGNDTVSLNSSAANNIIQFTKGSGKDVVLGYSSTNTIALGTNDSYTQNPDGKNVIISLVSGDVLTLNDATDKTVAITGGKKINSGPKNISNSSNNTLLSGSTLNDTITSSGNNVTIQANSGNDLITLQWTAAVTSNTVTVDAGDGADTVTAFGNYLSVVGGNGNDSISAHGNHQTISAGEGNDTIGGNHGSNGIYAGAGNDLVSITHYWNNTISGGAGDDTLAVQGGSNHSISGNAGNDKISLGSAASSTVYYANGDGNDTVWGFNSTDALSISGSYTNPKKSGKDVIVTVGKGKITFKDAATNLGTININGKSIKINDEEKIITQQDVIKTFMKSLDTSKNTSAITMLDNAIKTVANGKKINGKSITTIQQAIDAMVDDCESYNGDSDSFLKEKCGIILDNDDTGAITGSDAGGSETKTASSVVEEIGDVDKNFKDNYFYHEGLNVYLAKKDAQDNIQIINFDDKSLGDKERYIWQGLHSWWMKGSLDLITESYGDNFSFGAQSSNTMDKNLYVTFYNEQNAVNASVDSPKFNSSGDAYGSLCLNINMYMFSSIKKDNRDGENEKVYTSKGSYYPVQYLDRVLAHEFTHAVMNANIKNATGYSGLPQFIKDGMAELTHGVDDKRKNNIVELAKDFTSLDEALDVEKPYNHYPAYAGGYMFLRYITKQFSDYAGSNKFSDESVTIVENLPGGLSKSGVLIKAAKTFKGKSIIMADYAGVKNLDATVLSGAIEIMGNNADNSIKSGKGADSLSGGAGNDSLWGGAGNDAIHGGSGFDLLYGDAGNDSLYGGIGKNTLTGGAGKDVFVYEGGQDLIVDYKMGEDKLRLLSGSITQASVSNKNVILKTDSGDITIQGGAKQKITVIDSDGKESSTIYGKTLKVTKSSPVTLGLDYAIADASSAKVTVMITGNAMDNSILGGAKNDSLYGGAGADILFGNGGNDKLYGDKGDDSLNGGAGSDSLWGGAGNDSLFGGDGNDTFVYTANTGTGTIFDYSNGDMLQILDAKGSKVSFSKATFSNNDLTLSVKGGGTIIFDDVSSSTSFNINGTNYKISGTKLVKK